MSKLQKNVKLGIFFFIFVATFSILGNRVFAEVGKCLVGPGLTDCSSFSDLIAEKTGEAFDPAKCYQIMNTDVTIEDCTRAPFNLRPGQNVTEAVEEQAQQDAQNNNGGGGGSDINDIENAQGTGDTCGDGDTAVGTTVDLGCEGRGNGINDLLFAIIRFLVAGVGVVVIASVIVGGVQYSLAQGDPQKISAARGRVISALGALLLYLFIFALMQWLVPGGVF